VTGHANMVGLLGEAVNTGFQLSQSLNKALQADLTERISGMQGTLIKAGAGSLAVLLLALALGYVVFKDTNTEIAQILAYAKIIGMGD
ncbi:hypothetical protein, partial [Vibrio vulnificus]|uniref:hypothetical protein n=1 Tax=Vibrio vulnificus TaxID=672 RepID=UPI0039B624A6